MIVQHHAGSIAARLIANDGSSGDGMISLVIAAPLSVVDYLSFLYQAMRRGVTPRGIPSTIGYIKSERLEIDAGTPLGVDIDDEETVTQTPVACEVLPGVLHVNTGPQPEPAAPGQEPKERVDTRNLPLGSELAKATKKALPFFPYASEERFKDLFVALRDDARMSTAYVVLMVLSTLLATIGLYQNSTAVVIGAMLLAPLMAPIVSMAMGMVRSDHELYTRSAYKILAGILLALGSAALVSMMMP